MKPLETERLVLRRVKSTDAPFMLELLNDPAFLRFVGDRKVRTQREAERYIRNGPMAMYRQLGFGLFLVQLKESKLPIGVCGLLKRDTLEDVDIGFAFLPAYREKGYASESARAVLDHGSDVLRIRRIAAITSPDNDPSIHVLEKLGFRFEGMITLTPDEPEVRLFRITLGSPARGRRRSSEKESSG